AVDLDVRRVRRDVVERAGSLEVRPGGNEIDDVVERDAVPVVRLDPRDRVVGSLTEREQLLADVAGRVVERAHLVERDQAAEQGSEVRSRWDLTGERVRALEDLADARRRVPLGRHQRRRELDEDAELEVTTLRDLAELRQKP